MKLTNTIYGIAAVLLLAGCSDKMNYKEYTNYDAEYVKRTFGDVGGLISDIYLGVDTDWGNYSGAMLSSASDESQYAYSGNDIEDFYNGSWSASNPMNSMWTSCYESIAKCNRYLEEFTGLTFPELEQLADYNAEMYRYNNYQYEVRFMRAYFFFNLVRQYGAIPFPQEGMTTDEKNTLSRTPAQDMFDFIISECEAIQDSIIADYENLGDMTLNEPSETGRVDKVTVLALKARASLYAASPLFNTSDDQNLWYRAAKNNKELLDACEEKGMSLVEDYSSLWTALSYTNARDELIFGRRANTTTNSFEKYNFPIGLENCSGGNCPTQTLVDAYEMQATGLRPDEEGSGYDENDPYTGRDPRFALTIAYNGTENWPTWNTTPLQTYQNGANGEPLSGGTPTSYYLKKYCQGDLYTTTSGSSTAYHTWITFRLGEFYLNYAEAVFRYLGSPYATDSEFTMSAAEAVNVTRTRAQMPNVPTTLTNDEFWEKYQNERMVELAFENHRFWDVRRWREGDEHFSSIDQMKITLNSDGSYTYTRQTVSRQWDEKMYFFPIPQTEIAKNPNLTQNEGW